MKTVHEIEATIIEQVNEMIKVYLNLLSADDSEYLGKMKGMLEALSLITGKEYKLSQTGVIVK